ncbi:MAG: DedA family protein [Marinilabiliaceae bacterium]|nr:DedA family protein [Marinilabiliaceae bacterium]
MQEAEFVQWCLDNLNYWTVMLLMIIESSFIPFPSEIVVPPAAYRAASTGDMNIILLVLFATIGAIIGSLINYALAYYIGRPIIYGFARSRWGHLCLLDEAKVVKAEHFFEKHGAISTFIGRLIPAVRQLISIPAGLARMHLGEFIIFTTLGAGIWNVVLAAAGYYMQSILPEDEMMQKIMLYSNEFKIICLIIGVAVLIYLIYRFFFFKENKKPAI